jgi:exoribonuclease II
MISTKLSEAEFDMAKNPWLSLWLSAANTWAGAARSLWTAEMHRQHKAMLNEMTRPKPPSSTKTRSSKKAASGVRKKAKG